MMMMMIIIILFRMLILKIYAYGQNFIFLF